MEITVEDLISLLREHGEFGCYVQQEENHGSNGVVIDGWFNLEAIAAEINRRFRSLDPQT